MYIEIYYITTHRKCIAEPYADSIAYNNSVLLFHAFRAMVSVCVWPIDDFKHQVVPSFPSRAIPTPHGNKVIPISGFIEAARTASQGVAEWRIPALPAYARNPAVLPTNVLVANNVKRRCHPSSVFLSYSIRLLYSAFIGLCLYYCGSSIVMDCLDAMRITQFFTSSTLDRSSFLVLTQHAM